MGTSSPPLKGHSPQFSANVRCGQTAGWTKLPLGMKVCLGAGDFVFDGDPATPRKRALPPPLNFGPCLLWLNGWMDQDATWYGGKCRPRRRCVTWSRSSHPKRGTALLVFGSCLLWLNGWTDEDATWYTEVDLGPGHIVLDGVTALRERGTAAPLFGPCVLWPRSPISATAEVLLWPPCVADADIIFLPCGFYLLLFLP